MSYLIRYPPILVLQQASRNYDFGMEFKFFHARSKLFSGTYLARDEV